jgi:hypothetical protein
VLTLYALGHNDELLARVPDLKNVVRIALHRLPGAERYAEFRFFRQTRRINRGYLGFVSCRWAEKFPQATPIDCLDQLPFSTDLVYAPAPTNGIDWVAHSEHVHPGLGGLIPELADAMGIDLLPNAPTLWTSNFICHRQVWDGYKSAFDAAAKYADKRWGAYPPFDVGKYDPNRKVAYLLERATMAYFASRTDLNIVKV